MNPLGMDLVRVTEAAAISASGWIGTGDAETADRATTEVLRDRLNRINFAARVVIGQGAPDHHHGLFTVRPSAVAGIAYSMATARPTSSASIRSTALAHGLLGTNALERASVWPTVKGRCSPPITSWAEAGLRSADRP